MEDPTLTGSKLGKYEIREEIGRGGMGSVYLGYDPQLDRQVAIKVLAPHLAWDREFIERFMREARSAARLKHPHIVTIHDVGHEGGRYYFVMEYLPGESLAAILRRRQPLPTDEVLGILRALASALDYAHYHGIVHRDVKPGNVIIGQKGQVTLMDFGIARAGGLDRLTGTGTVVGTPEYMAPEQARGTSVDARSDQYSLAVMAYQMLSGQVPFQADSSLALMYQIVHEPPRPLRQLRPDLPAGAEQVLERALAKEPGARYGTATAFVEDMDRALAGILVESEEQARSETATPTVDGDKMMAEPGPATPAPEGAPAPILAPAAPPVSGTRRRVPGWIWAVGAAAVLVLAVGGILAVLGNGESKYTRKPAASEGTGAILGPGEVGETATPSPSPSTPPAHTQRPTGTPTELLLEATPTPPPSLTATAMPQPTDTSTATAEPRATATATPQPTTTRTATAQPAATLASERQPAATPESASPTPPPPTAISIALAPGEFDLLKPVPPGQTGFEVSHGPTLFEWQHSGLVGTDQGFEVRVWREGEPPVGAHDAVNDNKNGRILALGDNTYQLEVDISNVAGVGGRSGDYLWTVLLVQIRPTYQALDMGATPGRLRFEGSGRAEDAGGEGVGGGDGGVGGGE